MSGRFGLRAGAERAARLLADTGRVWGRALARLVRGAATGHGLSYSILLARELRRAMVETLEGFLEKSEGFGNLDDPRWERLRASAEGRHALLSREAPGLSYSILVPVFRPDPVHLEKALRACLAQTAPRLEVLVGFDGPQPAGVEEAVEKVRRAAPRGVLLKVLRLERPEGGGGISRTTNALAREATGDHLLLVDHDDWIRPDLLYRYEQALRLEPAEIGRAVLYCDEYRIDAKDELVWQSELRKPLEPGFPFLFVNLVCHCLLVPKRLWDEVGGLRPECDGAQDFDLAMRLDRAGARLSCVPFFLYAWRAAEGSTAASLANKPHATAAGVRALSDDAAARGLAWTIEPGLEPTTYRALPPPADGPILAVVPFRDGREMTLEAVSALLAQEGVRIQVVAVDNGSGDRGVGEALEALGARVVRVDEPFNYSRLNRIGVEAGGAAPLLLFVNNDVVLEPGAAAELARWAVLPAVGLVGARLLYPDDTVQHGGIDLDPRGEAWRLTWRHTDWKRPASLAGFSRVTRLCDAVTGACLMVRREAWDALGGFDEVFYPVAYSDTDLARRARAAGLKVLYTPYAAGIHRESASRAYRAVEDVEESAWLAERRGGSPPARR